MLLSCGLGLGLLSLSTAVALMAVPQSGAARATDVMFVLALIGAVSAVVLILVDLLVTYRRVVERVGRQAEDDLTMPVAVRR